MLGSTADFQDCFDHPVEEDVQIVEVENGGPPIRQDPEAMKKVEQALVEKYE